MTKVLITGSEGFIGKNLLNFFSSLDLEVISVDLEDFYYDKKNWSRNLFKDLEKYRPDTIFHVGACSDTLETEVNYIMEVNFECTRILSDWCFDKGSKLIYSSSAANYGSHGDFPSNLYGWSKYTAECYVVAKGGVALRYFNVYGPGESHKGKMSSVANQSFMKQKVGEKILIFPGCPKRDFVYIDDVVGANVFAYDNFGSLKGNWYDVGSSESRSFEDVLQILHIEDFGYTEVNKIPSGYQFNTKSKKWMPGWSPKFTLETGLEEYKKYLINNG